MFRKLWAFSTCNRERTLAELEGCPVEQLKVLRAVMEAAQERAELIDVVKGFVIDASRRRSTMNGNFVAEYGDRFYMAETYHEIAQQAADAL